jgi:hypothetical protein
MIEIGRMGAVKLTKMRANSIKTVVLNNLYMKLTGEISTDARIIQYYSPKTG